MKADDGINVSQNFYSVETKETAREGDTVFINIVKEVGMNKQQSGFTLIELIAVIVILGILAATAVPRFVDLSDAAEAAALSGLAGGLGSASALNHAANIAEEAGVTGAPTVINQDTCDEAANLLEPTGLPTGYTIDADALSNGTGVDCTLNGPGGTATFTGYGTDVGADA